MRAAGQLAESLARDIWGAPLAMPPEIVEPVAADVLVRASASHALGRWSWAWKPDRTGA